MQVQMRIPLRIRDIGAPFRSLPIEAESPVYWYKSGRIALYSALRNVAQSRQGKDVVFPAYHCRSMVDACEWAGLTPRFYEMNHDLSPNIASVRETVSSRSVAVMGVHYFGFPNELSEIVEICGKLRVPFIEDAAHIDVVNNASPDRVGNAGDWIIASPRKFYPIYDGGCLYSRKPEFAIPKERTKSTLGDEARSFLFAKDSLFLRTNITRDLSTVSSLDRPTFGGLDEDANCGGASNDDGTYVDRRFTHVTPEGMTGTSRIILRALVGQPMWHNRREKYRRLHSFLTSLRRCRPLFPELANDVVPYAFPVILEHPDSDHRKLLNFGIDIWRWEDLARSGCKVSAEMESKLIQLPCHQALSDEQLSFMEDVLAMTLK